MQQQKPASNGVLVASLLFFGLLGFGMAGLGVASLGKDSSAIGVLIFGIVVLAITGLITPAVFKGAEKQRKEYEKQLRKHDVEETVPVHPGSGGGSGSSLSGVGSIVVIVVVLVVGVWLVKGAWHFASDRINPPKWTGFFYYDPNDLDKYWTQGGLASLDDCRDWVNNQVSRDRDGSYDYECGKGCRYDSGLTVQVCKETAR